MSKVIKIACIGDSVVYGYGVPEAREEKVWTTLLEKLLNGGAAEEAAQDMDNESEPESEAAEDTVFEVRNYGLNGQSVIAGAFVPYAQINSPLYQEMTGWQPDAVFLHIGGNDSHRDIWDAEKFAQDYETLVQDVISRCGRKHVCLMAPPLARDEAGAQRMTKYGLQNDVIRDEINPVIRRTAEKLGTDIIDIAMMFIELPKMMDDCPPLYYDEIHPNEAGNELVADAAYAIAASWEF